MARRLLLNSFKSCQGIIITTSICVFSKALLFTKMGNRQTGIHQTVIPGLTKKILLIALFTAIIFQANAQLTLSNQLTGNNNWSAVNTWETGALNNAAITAGVTVTFNSTTNGIAAGDLIFNSTGTQVGTVLSVVPGVSVTLTAAASAAATANSIRVRRVPIASDNVNVQGTATTNITVDGTYNCNVLNVQTATNNINITLTITAGNSLAAGATSINNTSGGGSTNLVRIDVAGSFTCSSLTQDNPGGGTRDDELRISGGTVAITGALTMNGAANENAVTFNSNGNLYVGGNFTGTCTFTAGTGTTYFNGTGAQTIPAFNYYNLTITNARTTNSITLANAGTIGVANIFTPTATFTTGGYIVTGSTLDYNGTTAQTVAAFNYNNLTISGARDANSVTLENGGTIGIAGTFTPSATFTSGTYMVTGSTVNFNGNAAQNIPAFTFNNLSAIVLNATAARIKTLTGIVIINGDLTITGTSATNTITFNPAGFNLTVGGATLISTYGLFNDNTTAGNNRFDGSVTVAANGQFVSSNNPVYEFRNGITNNGTFTKSGTGSATFTTNSQTLSGTNALTFSDGDIIINDPVTLSLSTGLSFNGVNFTNNSNAGVAFSASAGTFTFGRNGAQNINGTGTGSITFYSLTAGGNNTKTANRLFSVTNDLTVNNGVTLLLGSTSGTYSIGNNAFLNGSGTLNLGTTANTFSIVGSLTVDGTLDFGTATAKTVNTSGDLINTTGTITMTGAGLAHTLNLGGANNALTTFNTTASSGSTVNYNRAGDQQVFASANYRNLTVSGGGTKSLQGATTINNSLTFVDGILQLGIHNLTLADNTAVAVSGTLNSSNMVETNSTGYLIRNAAATTPILFPVGSSGFYDPVTIDATAPTTGTISIRTASYSALGSRYVQRYWDALASVAGKNITATFNYETAEVTIPTTFIKYRSGAGAWTDPIGTQGNGINNFTITGTTNISTTQTSWTAGGVGTYYSYQTGSWNDPNTWTSDPGGTTQIGTTVPGNSDVVVILSGRTVSLPANITTTNLEVNISDGGILDMTTYVFTSALIELNGQGVLRLASASFPTVTTNTFVNAGGGTTEYYNSADFTLPVVQTTYNHLNINAPGVIATQLNNLTLNGDLHVVSGTFRINDNSASRRQLTVNGDVTVDAGANIAVGTGNTTDPDFSGGIAPYTDYYDRQTHRISLLGDVVNNGSIRLTNQSYPVYNAFTTNGAATVYFLGAWNSTLTCNGTTDLYSLVLDKGVDQTFSLTVYSSAYSNFRLFGRNDQGGENGTGNPDLRKALWIRTGSLILQGLTVIPSLTEANSGGSPNGDFYIPANASLVLDGTEVVILSTADDYREVNTAYGVAAPSNAAMGILTAGGTQSFSVYGKFQVNNGYFSTRESGGLITWNTASGQFVINGGTIDAKQFRSAGGGGGLASYSQSGGTLILRGRFQRNSAPYTSVADLVNATINTTRANGGLNGALGTFNLNEAANVYSVSGGIIRIYDVCGDGSVAAQQKAFEVLSSTGNINVTGGTLELIPTTGTSLADSPIHSIISNASLGNLTINRQSSTSSVQLVSYPMTVLNNFNITAGGFNANNLNVTVGGNVTISSAGTYNSGTNTTSLNGIGAQSFTIDGTINNGAPGLTNLSIDKSAGTLTMAGSQASLTVQGTFNLSQGIFNTGGKIVYVAGNVTNAGTHTGSGTIQLNGTNTQTVGGNGIFQNLEMNNTNAATAPVSLIANTTINGVLTFSQNKLFNIAGFNLKLGANASVSGAGAARFVQTNGDAGDGSITKTYSASATSFQFPVGAASTRHAAAEYTPATISFGTLPSLYGDITVVPVGFEHPNTLNKNRSLTYYWRVKSTGFTLGSATITQSFTYSQNDIVTGGDITEDGYIAARFSNASFTWTKDEPDDVDETNNIIGGAGTDYAGVNFIDCEVTAGDDNATDPFGIPTIYYSRINGASAGSGLWSNVNTWSLTGHTGAAAAAVPGASDIVIIGGLDSVYLATNNTTPNTDVRSCASLKIEAGSALDIGYNPGCNFAVVLNHASGNGNFRLTTSFTSGSTFTFPSGDFSEYNINLGTTELYSTNPGSGTTYWLPNNITSYGNLIISPLGGSNIIFGNTNVTILGNCITRGQNADSWFLPTWDNNYPGGIARISKTITINGNLDIQGGSFGWYGNNGGGAQNVVVLGDVTVAARAGIDVWSPNTSQSISIGGNLINNSDNSVAPFGTVSLVRLTQVPVTFFGSTDASITNTASTPTTFFGSVTVNKGASQATTLTIDIGGALTTPVDNWLTLQNGTLRYMRTNPGSDFTISQGTAFTVPSTAGLYIDYPNNSSNRNILLANSASNTNDVFLNGKLTLLNGNIYIGPTNGTTANNNDIEYSGGGASAIEVQGGNLIVNGQIRRNPATVNGILSYTQSGGNVVINGQAAIISNAKLEVANPGSVFDMSGGTLAIVRGGGTTYGDLYLRPSSGLVTGGAILFSQIPPVGPVVDVVQNYILDATVALNNLTITGKTVATARNATVTLLISPLTLNGNLTISNANSIFNANVNYSIDLTIKGDFTNNGSYTHYSNLTTFSGGVQILQGSSATDFYDLNVNPVTSLSLIRDITVQNDLTLTSGQLLNSTFSINVQGDLVNNANYDGDAVQGGVVLNGTTQQYISGTGTFGRLELNNSNGARLLNDISLQKNLRLTRGILDINQFLLTLGESTSIEGTGFNNTKMIASDGVFSNVGIRKYFGIYNGPAIIFTYPLGTSGKYTPVAMTYTNNGSVGYIRINNINDNHPGVLDPTNVLDYYWEVSSFGITNLQASMVFNYNELDVQVSGGNQESNYIGASLLLPGTSWAKIDNVDETANTIAFDYSSGVNGITGEFTAGIDPALPDEVPEYTSIATGDWSDKDNWIQTGGTTYALTGAPNGFIVTVANGHEVSITNNYSTAYRTSILGKLKVNSGTFGHNLGTVTGVGTLALESPTFPAGRYTDFLDCGNSAVLEYGGASNYTIVADLYNSVPRLYFTGTGTKTLPNKDLTICVRLLIDQATLDNSLFDRKLTIQGTMERINSGSFISGSGAGATVSFAGSAGQTLGGALGNFTGPNAFNNLEINNSADLTINSTAAIEVAGNLLLTDGLINTTSANTLTITNVSVNSVFPAGGSSASFVNGPLIKRINQGDSFQFPIGKGTELGNKLELSSTQTGTILWTAEYFTPNSTYTNYSAPLTYINSQEYWTVSALSGSQAIINIDWDSFSDLTPLNTLNGLSDMRVASDNSGAGPWGEIASNASGTSSAGTVFTSSRVSIPAGGFDNFTVACINTLKPKATLNPAGPVCGTDGIPISFSPVPPLNYTITYSVNGVSQTPITFTGAPYTIPTLSSGTYKLVSFTYNSGITGAVDQGTVVAYDVPTTATAGSDQSLCGLSTTTLAGNTPTIGTGLWSIQSGAGGTVVTPTSPTSTFNGTNGSSYTVRWTISNGGCTSSDQVNIVFPLLAAQPGAFTISSPDVCLEETGVVYRVPLDPTVSYAWDFTPSTDVTINGTTNQITADFGTLSSTGTLRVIASNGCGSSTPRTLGVTVHPLPIVSLASDDPDNIICNGSAVLFTASSASGPAISNYDFEVNATSEQSGAGITYNTSTLADGDIVRVIAMTAAGCTTISNEIPMTVADGIWTGVTSSDWFTASNWSCGGVPTFISDVVVPNGAVNMPVVNNIGAEFKNIIIYNTATLTTTATNNLDVYGNWTNNGVFTPNSGTVTFNESSAISGAATHTFNNIVIIVTKTLTAPAGTMHITGDITNSGTFNPNNGTIVLSGSALQNITGIVNFHNLEVDNPSGVVFTDIVSIGSSLTLTDGVLDAGGNVVTLGSSATVSPAAGVSNSYINGRVLKSNVGATFTFPIGSATRWRPVSINGVSSSGLNWSAEYFEGPATNESAVDNLTPEDPSIVKMSTVEYWKISDGNVGPSGISANVGLSWGVESAVSSVQSEREMLEIMAWDDTNSDWDNFGGGSFSVGHSQSQGSFSSISPVLFSEKIFTLGSSIINNPLPVELISFTGEEVEHEVLLKWSTATEFNNDYFSIEHSLNGYDFTAIGEVQGAGTITSRQNYTFIHTRPSYPDNYYRLKQVDFDGAYEYSDVIVVRINSFGEDTDFDFNIYPNPTNINKVTIKMDAIDYSQDLVLDIVNLSGAVLYQRTYKPAEIYSEMEIDFASTTTRGVYLMRLKQSDSYAIKKLIIQ